MGIQAVAAPRSGYQWLREAEARYSSVFRRISLIVEANLDPDDVATAARAIGGLQRQGMGWEDPRRQLLPYPATLIAAMVGSATRDFASNTYWPRFLETIGVPNSQENQTAYGELFLGALRKFGLQHSNSHRRYLDSVLMHAGIPDACLADLLNLLIDRKAQDPGLGAISFMAWALDPNGKNRLNSLDAPVQHFLKHAGEFALDIIERTMDVLAYLEDRRDREALQGLTSETTGLPEAMIRKFRSLVVDGDVSLERLPRVGAGSRQREHNPRLTLDWVQGSVVLALPSSATEAGSVTWTVSSDGQIGTITSQAIWIGSSAAAPAVRFDIHRPVKRIHVTDSVSGRGSDLTLVDPGDPLLLFDDDGQLLVGTLPIPNGAVWALWPSGTTLVDAAGRGPAFIVEEAPAEWPGWRLAQVDAAKLTELKLMSDGQAGRVRRVRQEVLPSIDFGPPLAGIRSPGGLPVYSMRPVVQLPDDAGIGVRWDIGVWIAGHSDPVIQHTGLVASGVRRLTGVLDGIAAPMIGIYTIQVRGPLGRKIRRTVAVAEELQVSYEPAVRLPVGTDLAPALARLTAGADGGLSESELHFGGKEVEKATTFSNGRLGMSVLVAPPHIEMLMDVPGIAAVWSPEVRRFSAESFAAAGDLLIRPPAEVEVYSVELRSAGGGDVQIVEPAARQRGAAFRFHLAKFADTARRAQWADLIANSSIGRLAIARIRPKSHASGVEVRGSTLRLTDCTHAADLTSAVYAVTAPWLGSVVCDINIDGDIVIPAEFGVGGDLRVYLAEDDGWGAVEWPRWPTADFLQGSRPGYREQGSALEQQLSRMIGAPANREELVCAPAETGMLWATLAVVDQILTRDDRQHLVHEIRRALHVDPHESALTLSSMLFGPGDAMELLVRSRLAEQPFTGPVDEVELRGLWSRMPTLAGLMASSAVTAARPGGESIDETDEIDADVALFGGSSMSAILDGQADPDRETARFDESAKRIAGMSKRDLDEIWRAAQIVPQGLLHGDSRVEAARELFDQRKSAALQPIIDNILTEIVGLRRDLGSGEIRRVRDQLDARTAVGSGGDLWQYLPAVSFSYAVRARMSARLPGSVGPLTVKSRACWRILARMCPKFVSMDLVLADALIASSTKSALMAHR